MAFFFLLANYWANYIHMMIEDFVVHNITVLCFTIPGRLTHEVKGSKY